ncbi:MAG: cytochrome c [Acidobacteriota bacterium]|nr:cytochrome c [Acidobacteriota bacterium]
MNQQLTAKNSITVAVLAAALVLLGTRPSTALQAETVSSVTKNGSGLDMDQIPRTPERLARGKYLVEGLMQCPACHSENDFSKRPSEVFPGKKLGGFVFPNAELGLPKPNRVVAPNISPDLEYGAGTWKDADFVRALRQGVGHDGRALYPLMPYSYFRNLSDEDLASVIVYERSVPPAHIKRPKTRLTEKLKKTFQPLPPLAHVSEPDRSDPVKYGEYLVAGGHCDGCHTPTDEKGNPLPGMYLAGGAPLVGTWEGGKEIKTVNALNLTPDPSGISYFDETMFIEVIRNGGFRTRPLSNIMPWEFFRNLTDDDLKAIFVYLRTLKPVRHHVDNTEPPTYCKQCRTKHGLGATN